MQYQNTQTGKALLLVIGGVLCFIIFTSIGNNNEVILPAIIILGIISFLFHSLNIQVDNNSVNWSFGPGFWKKSLDIKSINSVRVIKTKWYYGLGIRYIPSGWLYAVSGTTAVEFELKNGTKINLGTNDPDNLIKAIQSQLR
jgi:hypothetical protein